MKLIIYGDTHGCLDELILLREKIAIAQDDFEICAGDMINKGPYSAKLLDYIAENKIKAIIGNHEEKFIKYKNSLKRTVPVLVDIREKQKDLFFSLSSRHIEFLEKLPYFIRVANVTVLHGGLWKGARLDLLKRRDMSKIAHTRYLDAEGRFLSLEESKHKRHTYWSEAYDGSEGFIVYGHQVFRSPKVDRFSLGIDTGCVYGNKLTAAVFELEDDKFDVSKVQIVQQKPKKVYSS